MPTGPTESSGRTLANFVEPRSESGRTIAVDRPVARIGQGSHNEIVLEDDTVSTSHARLEYSAGAWRLTDLESRNGTYVEGLRLPPGEPTPLLDQASVAFGAMKLRFEVSHGADPEVLAPSPPSTEAATPRARGFRLPVWLLLIMILIMAVIVFLLVTISGDPTLPDTLPNASPVFLPGAADLTGA